MQQQQSTPGFEMLPVTPDYGGSSMIPADDMPFDAVNPLPLLGQDMSIWNGALTPWAPWEDGNATSTASNPPAAPTSATESTPSLNARFLASVADDVDTPEAARKAAIDYWRHSNRRGRSSPTFSNDRDETLVHTAARGNDVFTLKLLAQHGFPLNERDSEGRTPLHAAYAENHMEAILWLLENGADVNAIDNQGRSTLSMAVNNKCPIGVKLMLSHGAAPILAV
jgi:ankyrin repeat protein